MPCYVGLDVSKRSTKICILDKFGKVVREGEAVTEPSALAAFLRGDRLRYARIGMEASSMSPWLYRGLVSERLPIICIEARHASGILKGRLNKTDRNDA